MLNIVFKRYQFCKVHSFPVCWYPVLGQFVLLYRGCCFAGHLWHSRFRSQKSPDLSLLETINRETKSATTLLRTLSEKEKHLSCGVCHLGHKNIYNSSAILSFFTSFYFSWLDTRRNAGIARFVDFYLMQLFVKLCKSAIF